MKIPGYIDLQINGFAGIDFSSPDLEEEQFVQACKLILKKGTAAFLPTIITSSIDTFERNLRLMSVMSRDPDLRAHIPGLHVEGPFISEKDGARGAHSRKWIRKPDKKLLDSMMSWADGQIKLLTMAAEVEAADELCRHAVDMGITVSLGHHMATDDDLKRMVDAGATALTHLGNGLPAQVDRHRNPIWAGLANDDLTAMLIADGQHLPLAVLKTMIRSKGPDRICLVSDASPVAGLPPGKYQALGNEVILDNNGKLYNPETGYLVGSSFTMDKCIDFMKTTGLLDEKSLEWAYYYKPLQLIGIDPDQFASVLNQ
jgi:N-acetylglucosamine-6-phosphate deacetylase